LTNGLFRFGIKGKVDMTVDVKVSTQVCFII